LLINSKFRWACLPLAVFALTGCRQDMQDQPKFKPLGETSFFPDKRQSRPDLPHTVARGDLRDGDSEFYTGKSTKLGKDGKEADVDVFPITVDKELIERGHQRFDVFCSPCHGRLGNGLGMIVRRGFKQPPSYHTERLRTAPVGHFYDVMTNGYGAMYSYSAQTTARDRWAIASYIRVLQYSQNQKVDQLSAEAKAKLPAKPNPEEEPILPGGRADQENPPAGAPTATPAGSAGTKPGAMNK
jgi:mono/diheme cytochrome c family protein